MKKLLALALTLALAALPSWAADVSAAALQGRWLITSVEGEPEFDDVVCHVDVRGENDAIIDVRRNL